MNLAGAHPSSGTAYQHTVTVKAFPTYLLLHAGSLPTIASTASPMQPAKPPVKHDVQPLCGLRGKPGSLSPTAATATVTPSGKSSGQPAQPFLSLASTPRPKPTTTLAGQADDASHIAETSLPAHSNSTATSTPVQPESRASGHGNAALLPHVVSAQKLPMQPEEQASKRGNHDAIALLPAPKVTVPFTGQVNAEPGGKPAATISQVQPSMKRVIKHAGKAAAAISQIPQSRKEGVRKDTDSLLMVRRLPAVLTGTLPTLESLGVQVNLPSGADMLSKALSCCKDSAACMALLYVLTGCKLRMLVYAEQLPRKPQGSGAKHVQELCHSGMVKGLQSCLVPQAAYSETSVTDSHSQATEDAAAFLMQSMQDNRC